MKMSRLRGRGMAMCRFMDQVSRNCQHFIPMVAFRVNFGDSSYFPTALHPTSPRLWILTGASIPLSQLCIAYSPYFRQIHKFPPLFLFFLLFSCFSPYFDHDAFMHHAQHVLEAPGFL